VRIHGEPVADRSRRVPTISFSVEGGAPETIVRRIDAQGIGIRHGHFYSQALVRGLGLEAHGGVIRVSMVHYNTIDEIERLVAALDPVLPH
jgi:selenocysteine lyase/cysteine desulfurase